MVDISLILFIKKVFAFLFATHEYKLNTCFISWHVDLTFGVDWCHDNGGSNLDESLFFQLILQDNDYGVCSAPLVVGKKSFMSK